MKGIHKKNLYTFWMLLSVLTIFFSVHNISVAVDGEPVTFTVQIPVEYEQTSARSMLALINDFRTGNEAYYWNSDDSALIYVKGLKKLTYSSSLEKLAMQRAAEIALNSSHQSPDGTYVYVTHGLYENIFMGMGTYPYQYVFDSFKEDYEYYYGQGHRRNMLSEYITSVGIGHVKYRDCDFWVQLFGTAQDGPGTAFNGKKSVSITVRNSMLFGVSNFVPSPASVTLNIGENKNLPTVTVQMMFLSGFPLYIHNFPVPGTWTSANTSIVKISGGKLVAVSPGKTSISTTIFKNKVTVPVIVTGTKLEIKDSNIRGKNKEIQIVIPWNSDLKKVECTLYNNETGQKVNMPLRERMDSIGKNRIISYAGDPLVNGKIYRFKVRVWDGSWSNYVEKYAMPIPNVFGATVVAMNKTMVINNQHREPTSGARYMIFDAATEKELAYMAGTRNETTWSYNKLTNGKLYYVVAVPYRDYKGQRLWGPNENRIYFIPMSAPGDGNVSFSGSNASVSIRKDSDAEGIRVLYRTVGGKLQNGCEGKGNKCTISGLNKNTAYEFYAMKYKTAQNKKYYSMGILIPYKTAESGLKAPQSNPVVTMTNSGYTKFSIKLAANAQGISVLYREGEGAFKQACEKAGNTCDTNLNVKSRYTFYIMQYRTVNGKKLYSNGIIARDFSSMKNGEYERVYNNFYLADEFILQEEIAAALDDYLTEDAMLMAEAMEAICEDLMAKSAEEYEYEFIEDDDSWIEEYARFDSDVMAETIEKQAVPEPQPEEEKGPFSWLNFFFLGGDNNNREAPVPSFENK